MFRGILELGVQIVAKLVLFYFIMICVVRNSFKFVKYNIFFCGRGSVVIRGPVVNYVNASVVNQRSIKHPSGPSFTMILGNKESTGARLEICNPG
jgi:hypothetical protein